MIAIPPHSPIAASLVLFSTLTIAACSAGAKPADAPASQPAPSATSEGAAGAPPAQSAPGAENSNLIGNPTGAVLPKDAKPMEATVEIKNTIRWSTASEVENFGYDVYRGDAEEGPFVRLTAKPIPGAGTSDEPHKYSYVDKDIDPTKDYWYYVESVSYAGVRERFTPVQKAKAKQPK
ncbi:MAG TPA: hypothetical protein VN851_26230 [Thermoanaerobaculia bacterium]|nr:hypothetical protein [Thermoanaerobaculia bacterium]